MFYEGELVLSVPSDGVSTYIQRAQQIRSLLEETLGEFLTFDTYTYDASQNIRGVTMTTPGGKRRLMFNMDAGRVYLSKLDSTSSTVSQAQVSLVSTTLFYWICKNDNNFFIVFSTNKHYYHSYYCAIFTAVKCNNNWYYQLSSTRHGDSTELSLPSMYQNFVNFSMGGCFFESGKQPFFNLHMQSDPVADGTSFWYDAPVNNMYSFSNVRNLMVTSTFFSEGQKYFIIEENTACKIS